jgi:hypothetical protein
MAESPKPKEETKPTLAVLTLADAALLARKDLTECLAFKDYGNTVVVVTVAGQKITVAKDANV